MPGQGSAQSAGARVCKEREVTAFFDPQTFVFLVKINDTPFGEVVAATGGPQLGKCLVFESAQQSVHIELLAIQHVVVSAVLAFKAISGAENGMRNQFPFVKRAVVEKMFFRNIEHRQGHAATDIHPYAVWNDGVSGGQHPADRQAIALVRIRHERAGDRYRQLHSNIHLVQCPFFDLFFPENGVHVGCFFQRNGGIEGLLRGFDNSRRQRRQRGIVEV